MQSRRRRRRLRPWNHAGERVRPSVNQLQQALLSIAFVFAGCQRPTDAASSNPAVSLTPTGQKYLAARPLGASCSKPGESISPGPTVVVTDKGGRPWPNVAVTFSVGSGGGENARR